MGFGGGGGKQRPSSGKVGVGHAERRLSTWVGALSRGAASDVPGSTGKPEPAFQSAESALPVQNRPNPGRAPFWPPRGARRNLGVRFRLIRAVSTRRATQSCTDPRSGAEPCAALWEGRARSRRKVLRLYRHPTAEARSPPARSARFPHPVQVSQRGVRAAAVKACLVIYNDDVCPGRSQPARVACPALGPGPCLPQLFVARDTCAPSPALPWRTLPLSPRCASACRANN